MSQPATAGIIVACIFAAMAILYFGYRGYVKWHRRKTAPTDDELPPIRELQPSYIAGGTANSSTRPWPTSMSSMGTLYSEQGPYGKTHTTSGSRPSLGAGSIFRQSLGPEAMTPGSQQQLSYHNQSRRNSAAGLLSPTNDSSLPSSPIASPTEMGTIAPLPAAATDSDIAHGRVSSASSTMTLKRTYAGSVYKGATGNSPFASSPTFERQQRRDSWLPHSPLNRDSIHIVPPQPLGVGFGSMATAMDERTLAFSKTSGIGSGEEIFGQGLVWGAPGSNQTGPAPAGTQPWSAMSQDQRSRYLQDGPSRGLAAQNTSTSSFDRGSLTNPSREGSHIGHYLPPDSRAMSPSASASNSGESAPRAHQPPTAMSDAERSRTTSMAKSFEAVEATLGEMPSAAHHEHREALSHLKSVSSSSDAYANPAAFTAQTSPLQALSQQQSGMNVTHTAQSESLRPEASQPAPSVPAKDGHAAASSYHQQPQRLGTPEGANNSEGNASTGGNPSPILGAFRVGDSPASQLAARSDLGPRRSPSPGKGSQLSAQPSINGPRPSADFSGRRVMLGQDGKLEVSPGSQ